MFLGHTIFLKLVCGWFSNKQAGLRVKKSLFDVSGERYLSLENIFVSEVHYFQIILFSFYIHKICAGKISEKLFWIIFMDTQTIQIVPKHV